MHAVTDVLHLLLLLPDLLPIPDQEHVVFEHKIPETIRKLFKKSLLLGNEFFNSEVYPGTSRSVERNSSLAGKGELKTASSEIPGCSILRNKTSIIVQHSISEANPLKSALTFPC